MLSTYNSTTTKQFNSKMVKGELEQTLLQRRYIGEKIIS